MRLTVKIVRVNGPADHRLLLVLPAGFTGPINISNQGKFTMIELAEKLLSHVEGRLRRVLRSPPSDNPTQRQPDIALAKSELG